MKGQQIHQRAEWPRQLRESIPILGRVIRSLDQDVFERHPPAEGVEGRDHLVQPVLSLYRHQREPALMGRRVERQREPELLGPSRELRQIGNDAYRADRDVPGADREPFGVVEDRQRPVHGFPIVERLPHSHEDDVGRLAERRVERHFANLAHDLPGLEVPAEAHAAGSAKNAAVGATRLRRNAECTTLSLGNQDRLDLGTVREPPEELSGAIARELSGGEVQSWKGAPRRSRGRSLASSQEPTGRCQRRGRICLRRYPGARPPSQESSARVASAGTMSRRFTGRNLHRAPVSRAAGSCPPIGSGGHRGWEAGSS